MNPKEKEYLLYGGAGLAIIVAATFFLKGQTSAATGSNGGYPASTLNTLITAQENVAAADSAAAITQSQNAMQTLLSYENSKNNLALGLATLKANTKQALINANGAAQIAQIQGGVQEQITALQSDSATAIAKAAASASVSNTQTTTAAEVAAAQAQATAAQNIANTQAQASQNIANTQANVANTASNNNFWSSILGSIGSAFAGV